MRKCAKHKRAAKKMHTAIQEKKFWQKPFYKWEVLLLLWFAFLLNQADRQIYNTLLEKISASLDLTSAEAGLVATLFSLVFAMFVPLSGLAADRLSKKSILCFAVFLWSFATIASGACYGFIAFIVFRSVATGFGEACFGPANYSTIAEWHEQDTRARAMSIHQTSYYFGVIVSGALAGWIADNWGWRAAFYVFGTVGIALGAVIFMRLKDRFPAGPDSDILAANRKPKDCAETANEAASKAANEAASKAVNESADKPAQKPSAPTFAESLKAVLVVPTALCLTIAFSGLIFVLQGYLTWSTFYLQEKFGLSNAEAGFSAVFYTHIAAFVGILAAGWISDAIAKKSPRLRILMQAVGLLCACPFIVMMGISESLALVYVGFLGFGFFRAAFDANTYAVLYDVIGRRYRSSAAGVMLFLGFGTGSFAPYILGLLKPVLGLSLGISLLAAVWVLAAALLIAAYKFFYMRDLRRAMEADRP